jgi:hypothetical protein
MALSDPRRDAAVKRCGRGPFAIRATQWTGWVARIADPAPPR